MWRYLFLIITFGLPFLAQKAHLDATRGGWRPELAGFSWYLLLASLVLLAALALLPLRRRDKFVYGALLALGFLPCFAFFTLSYRCDAYNYACI